MSKLDDAISSLPIAILNIQTSINWRTGSALRHLKKRTSLGHLPESATIADYNNIIRNIVSNSIAEVYLYQFNDVFFPTIVADINNQTWLVMFTQEGVMETSFVIENPHIYLSSNSFIRIGNLGEVLHE